MSAVANPIPEDNTDGLAGDQHLHNLLQEYAVPGPRYTSYPTALNFNESFSFLDYHRQLEQARASTSPLSLYVHIPFCHKLCYYCACNKIITRNPNAVTTYLDYLRREVELLSERIGNNRKIVQLHLGGGTPTYLDEAEITELVHMLASHLPLDDRQEREYSIEVDPRSVTSKSIALLRGLGFNRLSFGVQDTNPQVQRAINRVQSTERIIGLIDAARRYRFRSVSTDLIYGLPHQTRDSFEHTLDDVLAMAPDRIALYHYAHLPQNFKWQKALNRHPMPDSREKLALLQVAVTRLQEAGYLHIGMDHFVRPEDDLASCQQSGRLQRNFQGYSTCMSPDVLAVGVSAISSLRSSYAQNHKDLSSYYAALDRGELPIARGLVLTADDQLRRYVIMQLACNLKLDCQELLHRFHVHFAEEFAEQLPALRRMQQQGIIQINHSEIRVTELGRLFLRNLCMLFDQSLNQHQMHYSKAL